MSESVADVVRFNRDLFTHLEEFFTRATGCSVTEFATIESFDDEVRKNASRLATRMGDALSFIDSVVRDFYSERSLSIPSEVKKLGGMKLVLGGGGRFLGSQLDSVSTSILYSDSVLIPDPVLPWLERERAEEKFQHVLIMQAVHTLLHLKPLIDAELPFPPVVVFPSWEKSLEEKDEQTKLGISQTISDIVSHSLKVDFSGLDEVLDYADRDPARFCEGVDRGHLFVGPNGPIDEALEMAMKRYEKDLEVWRSREWIEEYSKMPFHQKVLHGLAERVAPIYHLVENAEEISAHPLMCLDQHAHYFKLVSQAGNSRLERLGLFDAKTSSLTQALASRELKWLGKASPEALVELRRRNENAAFRKLLNEAVGRIRESELTDVDKVASEVCIEIDRAALDHERELKAIQDKYRDKHLGTVLMTIGAAGALIMPSIAPLLGKVGILRLAYKYGFDLYKEEKEVATLSGSLIGFLAKGPHN